MERNPEEELFERLAEAIGEPLEQVYRMPDLERRQLIEVLGLGHHVAKPLGEEKVGQGAHEVGTAATDASGVGDGVGTGQEKQRCGDQVELEESSAKPKDLVSTGEWASSVERQLKMDTVKLEHLLVGTNNEAMGEDHLEAYLQAHLDNPDRVKVVLEELAGVDVVPDDNSHLFRQDAKANEEVYQGKGKGQGKGKSSALKRGFTDVDLDAEAEHSGKGVMEKRETKQRKLEENDQGVESAVENQHENTSPRLAGTTETVVDPKEVDEEERLLILVEDAHKEPDAFNPGPALSEVSKKKPLGPLKLKDIKELVDEPEDRLVEQEFGENEAVNPGAQQAQNGQTLVNLDESVVILDPMPNQDGTGGDDEQVLQLLRRQSAPAARDCAYSPEVRKLAESLAEMFPSTPVSYLLHR